MTTLAKLLRLAVVAAAPALAATLFPSAAEAGTITLEYGPGQYSANGGGEFKVSQFSGAAVPTVGAHVNDPGGYFQTFCLEYSETFATSTMYDWTLSDAAHAGGGDAAHGAQQDANGNWFDPISAETAFLYTQFWNGTLSWTDSGGSVRNYDYTVGSGRSASAGALQRAIWYLENERSISDQSSDAYRMVVAAQNAVSSGQWTGIGGVRVLTLTDSAGGRHQDQLFMVPLPPAALLGLGLMSGIGAVRRWRRRSANAAL